MEKTLILTEIIYGYTRALTTYFEETFIEMHTLILFKKMKNEISADSIYILS